MVVMVYEYKDGSTFTTEPFDLSKVDAYMTVLRAVRQDDWTWQMPDGRLVHVYQAPTRPVVRY